MTAPRLLGTQGSARYALGVAAILGLALWHYWPTLHDGLFADDYVATAILDGHFAAPRSAYDLFNFAAGTPEDVRALRRLGSLPWWAPDDHRIAFLRPLSSALWHVDRALFGTNYGAYHAHSLLVFTALVVCVSWLYRRLFAGFSANVVLVATLCFALDESLRFPTLWLSNRGGMYALLLGVLALHAHISWRQTARLQYAFASALALGVGLLFGEWALPLVAYIAAYELIMQRTSMRARLLALLPSFVPSAVFLVLRSALHYGARGSGAYVDPGVDPLRFVQLLAHRVPVFFADMLWNVPAEWWDHGTPWRERVLQLWIFSPEIWVKLPDWHFFHVVLGVLGMLATLAGYVFCRRQLPMELRRCLHFLGLGGTAALVPVVGSFPSTRLTIAACIGLCPLFALVLHECALRLQTLTKGAGPPWTWQPGRLARSGCLAAVFGLGVYTQVYTPLQGDVQGQLDHYATTLEWVRSAELDPARVHEQRVVLLAGAEFTTTFFFSYIWAHAGLPLPRSYYPISSAPCAHFLRRTADDELM
ncbi:MAG: hypothetical protein RL701_2537, partial [Pseudomonadota bacterium]